MAEPWTLVPLAEVLTLQRRWVPPEPNSRYIEIGVRSYGRGIFHKAPVTGSDLGNKRVLRIEPGDLVLMNVFAWEGAVAVAGATEAGMIGSHRYATYTANPARCIPDFLNLYFKTESGLELLRRVSPGSAGRNRTLNLAQFIQQSVPLPPIEEQRRIVSRIEAIAAKVEAAQRLRRAAIEEARALTGSLLYELLDPDRMHWPVVPLGEVAEVRAGVTLGRRLTGDTASLPYLRVANVQDGFLDLTTVKSVVVLRSEVDKWRLERGDILVTEGGDWDKLGRGTVWGGEIEGCIHQNHILRIRVPQAEFEPRFVSAALGSPIGKEYFRAASKQTTNLASINQRQLKAFPLPRPRINEQRRILAAVDQASERAAALSMTHARAQRELDAVLPAVLHRAFRGEL